MRPTEPDVKPQITVDAHQYALSDMEEAMLRDDLLAMTEQIENFPIADFHVLIEGNARTKDVSIKLTLVLPGKTLVVGDHDTVLHAAFERSRDRLRTNLQEYKDRLGRVPERDKLEQGTHHQRHPVVAVEAERIDAAVEAGNYSEFRAALLPYEEELRKVIGRWVQRYPELEAQIDQTVKIADLVEETFLIAFEEYAGRPSNVTLGDWLQSQIDPAIKAMLKNQSAELENIEYVRSAAAASIDERPSDIEEDES